MNKAIKTLNSLLIILITASGCQFIPGLGPTAEPPIMELMPDLPEYNMVEGELLTEYISSLSEGAAMLAARPDLAIAIAGVDHVISCYQEVGAIKARLYSNKETPLAAGVVAMADRNALLDPANLFKCATPPEKAIDIQSVELEACMGSYTLKRDNNEFYILYAGTTTETCEVLCNHLEGCPESKP